MSTMVMNFKCVEVVGATKEEALEKAPFNSILKDATQAYKNWHAKQSTVTAADKKQFMLDYIAKNSKNAPGVGFSITETPAVKDTRERPWTITDIKNEGKRGYKTFHVLKDAATGVELGRVDTTKKDAKDLAKEIIANGFKGKGYSELQKQVVEGSAKEFTFEYTPSKSTQNGTYTVFGIVAE